MSQVIAPKWITNTWRASFFFTVAVVHGSLKSSKESGKASGFYWQLCLLVEMSILVLLCLYIATVINDEYDFAIDYFHDDGSM